MSLFDRWKVLLWDCEDKNDTRSICQVIETSSLILAFSAKFFISGKSLMKYTWYNYEYIFEFFSASFSVVYTYTAELFPTSVRTIGLGIGSLGGGLGGVLAPYILSLQVNSHRIT